MQHEEQFWLFKTVEGRTDRMIKHIQTGKEILIRLTGENGFPCTTEVFIHNFLEVP
jgi:hypothetical protein